VPPLRQPVLEASDGPVNFPLVGKAFPSGISLPHPNESFIGAWVPNLRPNEERLFFFELSDG